VVVAVVAVEVAVEFEDAVDIIVVIHALQL
jgi:hypothetical protein